MVSLYNMWHYLLIITSFRGVSFCDEAIEDGDTAEWNVVADLTVLVPVQLQVVTCCCGAAFDKVQILFDGQAEHCNLVYQVHHIMSVVLHTKCSSVWCCGSLDGCHFFVGAW